MNSLPALPIAILGLGPTELIVILVILLLLFGGSKLPGLAKGLGQSIKEFKKASKEGDEPEKPAETKSASTKPKPSDKN
ncbi:MAG: twin-arginine translocase TatA/TatE family subunit [Verrucomicrobia bacterium]|nr:twin-arginine translocase TatA/TatE family subunit [Verrucomicrobiota bacterium]